MAAVQLLATGQDAASADFSLADGEQATLILTGDICPQSRIHVYILNDDSEPMIFDSLTFTQRALSVRAVGDYRVTRPVQDAAGVGDCGDVGVSINTTGVEPE